MKHSVMFLVVVGLFLGVAASDKVLQQNQVTNAFLLNLMGRTNALTQRNAERSADCFGYYRPLLNEITETYERKHDACMQSSKEGRYQAEIATMDKRNKLASDVNSTSEMLIQCQTIQSAESSFKCYVDGSAEGTKTIHNTGFNASEYLSDLQQEFRSLDYKEYKCTNDTKRAYESEWGEKYSEMNGCILGVIDIPTETQVTEEPTARSTTEAVPKVVTEAVAQESDASLAPEDPINPESRPLAN